MQVSNISSPLSFTAKTTINASEAMLSEEDKKQLIYYGSGIGGRTDSIDISVSDVFKSDKYPDTDVFEVKSETKFGRETAKSTIMMPFDKISPAKYLKRFFRQLEREQE